MAKAVVQVEDGQRVIKHGAAIASGVTLAEGDLVGLNSSGEIVIATNASGSNIVARGVVLTASTVGQFGATKVLTKITYFERVKLNGLTGLTIGATLWLSTAGAVTGTKPSGTGTTNQVVGYAVSATEAIIDICPFTTTN